METLTSQSSASEKERKSVLPLPWLVAGLAIVALGTFIIATPGGLLSKTDWVGYAVCHRIGSHSFHIGGRQLPLCARCTGTFIGALIGLFGQVVVLRRRRAAEFPHPLLIVILVLFPLLWAGDGINSFLAEMPNGSYLYEPRNWLRLTTGALHGLTLSAMVYPVFNFTLWQRPRPVRAIRNLRDLGVLILLEVALIGLVLTQWSFLLYPLALLSALGVLTLLTCVNSMLVLLITGRENVANTWRESLIPLLAGFTVSLIQAGAIDIVRYALTGTLTGIPPLQ